MLFWNYRYKFELFEYKRKLLLVADPGFLRVGSEPQRGTSNLLSWPSFPKTETENEEHWTGGICTEICLCRSATTCLFWPSGFNLTRKSTSQTDNNLLNSDLCYCAAQWDQNVENSIRLPLSRSQGLLYYNIKQIRNTENTTNNDPSSHSNKEDSASEELFMSTTRLGNPRWKQ